MLRRGIFMIDQVLRACDEIVEDVLLANQLSSLMPFFAVFPTAAKIGVNEDAVLVEPNSGQESEQTRRCADIEAAITVEKRGMAAIQLRALAPENVQWDA